MVYVVYDHFGWMVEQFYNYSDVARCAESVNGYICTNIIDPWR